MSEVVTWLDTIGRVFEGIPDLAAPDEVEVALSEILEDPLLQLYWWDWELERYVDVRGVAAEPAAPLRHIAREVCTGLPPTAGPAPA